MTTHARPGRLDAWLCGAFVFIVLALPLWTGGIFYERDIEGISASMFEAVHRARVDDTWPLSALIGNGASLLAAPENFLWYPPAWLVWRLPAEQMASWLAVMHLALGAAFTTTLVRTFRVSRALAVGAGLAWALCGPTLDLITHGYYVVAAAWLPLGWWGARRAWTPSTTTSGALLAGAALAGCLLGCEPQSAGTVCGLLVLEAAHAAWRRRRRRAAWPHLLQAAVRVGIGAVAGIGVGLSVWWEQFAEGALMTRARGLSIAEAMMWPIDAASLVGTLWPGFLHWGALDPRGPALTLSPALATTTPWTLDPYLGPLLLASAGMALWLPVARSARVVAIVSFLLALGAQTPVAPVVWRVVPLLSNFRYPAKYWLPFALAVVVLAVVAWQDALRRSRHRWRLATWCCAAMLALFASAAVLLPRALGLSSAVSSGGMRDDAMLEPGRTGALLAVWPVVAALGLLVVIGRAPTWVSPRVRALLAAVLLCGSLLVVAPQQVRVGTSLKATTSLAGGLARTPPSTTQVPSVVCVDKRFDALQVLSPIDGGEDPIGTAAWGQSVAARIWLVPDRNVFDGLAGPVPYGATLASGVAVALAQHFTPASPAAVRAAGCSVLIADVRAAAGFDLVPADVAIGPGAHYDDAFPMRPLAVHDPVPVSFVVHDPALVRSSDVVRRVLATTSAAQTVAVLDDPLGRLPAQSSTTLPDGSGVTALRTDWPRRDRATLHVDGTGGAVVGLRTAHLVGWRAQQAGVELPVVRSSGMFVAAVVPDVTRGPVELSYAPVAQDRARASVVVGLALFALLSGLLLAPVVRDRARAQR